ncbi:hypothetical protein, partial [Planococcus plakortidis]|uniref:hypothetical protein n=1 Tax=Planococcus plakortidis TaxID=1038856 RepID=UPI00386D62E4
AQILGVKSHSSCAAKSAASPDRLMPVESTWALALFFLSSSSAQILGVKSHSSCAAKSAASPDRLMPVESTWA